MGITLFHCSLMLYRNYVAVKIGNNRDKKRKKRKEHECRITNLIGILMGLCVCILTACGRVEKERSETAVQGAEATLQQTAIPENYYTENSKVTDVMRDPTYGDYGHLIFPVDIAISEDLELKDVEDILPGTVK